MFTFSSDDPVVLGEEHYRMRLQSTEILMDEKKCENASSDHTKNTPSNSVAGGMDIVLCTDTATKCNQSEIATAKGESVYSEIPSVKHPREQASSGDVKSEATSASTTATLESGYNELLGEHGNPWVPQEALYDQPVSCI